MEKKVTAKQVSVGMIFQFDSIPRWGGFGTDEEFVKRYDPPIGTRIEIVKEPYRVKYNAQVVRWKEVGKSDEWVTAWERFKENTSFVSGTIKAPAAPPLGVVITSKGPVAGFTVSVSQAEVTTDIMTKYGYGCIYLEFSFQGTFTGAKRMNDQVYNELKKSPALKTFLFDATKHVLAKHDAEIDEAMKHVDPTNKRFKDIEERDGRAYFQYGGKKLHFSIYIMSDKATLLSEIENQIDAFIASPKCNVPYYKML